MNVDEKMQELMRKLDDKMNKVQQKNDDLMNRYGLNSSTPAQGTDYSTNFGGSSFDNSSFGNSSFGNSSFGNSSFGGSSFDNSSFGTGSFGTDYNSGFGTPPPPPGNVQLAAEFQFCPMCGAKVSKDAMFCELCGSRLGAAGSAPEIPAGAECGSEPEEEIVTVNFSSGRNAHICTFLPVEKQKCHMPKHRRS